LGECTLFRKSGDLVVAGLYLHVPSKLGHFMT